jgi:hypothetical protein
VLLHLGFEVKSYPLGVPASGERLVKLVQTRLIATSTLFRVALE